MKAVALALVAAAAAATTAEIAPEERRSGYDFAAPETRAMQDDDSANPGILGVLQGSALWAAKTGTGDRSCADCHGDAPSSMMPAPKLAFPCSMEKPITFESAPSLL